MIYYKIGGRLVLRIDAWDRYCLWGLFILFALVITLFFTSCATPQINRPYQAVVIPTPSNSGFLFSQHDKDFLVAEGIPSSYFTLTPSGWYMTKQDEIRAGELRASIRNKGVWTP